ncbi:hypothetical protein [Methanolobus vulcani]|nr:hypothetical protein [Methanolobus vulcani]
MVFLVLVVLTSGCTTTQEEQTSSDTNSSDVQMEKMEDAPTGMDGNMTPT